MDVALASSTFRDWMWSPQLSGTTDFNKLYHSGRYPLLTDVLTTAVAATVVLSLVKVILNKTLFAPLIQRFLTLNKPKRLPFKNDLLEAVYIRRRLNLPDINEIKQMSLDLKLEVEDLNKWFKIRQYNDRFTVRMSRCKEGLFRLSMYIVTFFFAAFFTHNFKVWQIFNIFTNLGEINKFDGNLNVTRYYNDVLKVEPQLSEKMYFLALQLPLYYHLSVTHVLDFKRRINVDFFEMFSHHFLVSILLTLMYLGDYLKITTFALMLHDFTEILLEVFKLFNYFNMNTLSVITLLNVTIFWGYMRLYMFGRFVLYCTVLEQGVIGYGKMGIVAMASIIWVLNVYWFLLIARVTYRVFWGGVGEKKRERAVTDLSTDEEVDTEIEEDESVDQDTNKKHK